MKIDYKRLGLFIPVLCIVLMGYAVQKNNFSEQSSMAPAAVDAASAGSDASQEKPQIALTFDDGPHPRFTARLLDGLAKRNVKATFFLLGKNIEGQEAIVKRIYQEGHLIGNHCYSHVRLTSLSDAKAREEITKTNELIYDISGVYPNYIRPPFGAWKTGLEYENTMVQVLWTVDSCDWEVRDADRIFNTVIENTGEGDIILMHDWYESSVDAALRIVDHLSEQGYEFVTIEQMIFQ